VEVEQRRSNVGEKGGIHGRKRYYCAEVIQQEIVFVFRKETYLKEMRARRSARANVKKPISLIFQKSSGKKEKSAKVKTRKKKSGWSSECYTGRPCSAVSNTPEKPPRGRDNPLCEEGKQAGTPPH